MQILFVTTVFEDNISLVPVQVVWMLLTFLFFCYHSFSNLCPESYLKIPRLFLNTFSGFVSAFLDWPKSIISQVSVMCSAFVTSFPMEGFSWSHTAYRVHYVQLKNSLIFILCCIHSLYSFSLSREKQYVSSSYDT